jgi:SAM-dependent methyltransferase
MRRRLYRAYWACEQRLAPGLQYSQDHYEQALREVVTSGCAWLDIGCGHQVLPPWRRPAEMELVARAGHVVGADPDAASLTRHPTIRHRTLASLSHLPFRDMTFDLATANMVVEHLDDPLREFAEVARVLRPGGKFLLHTPNARAYTTRAARLVPARLKAGLARRLEGRPPEDVFPTRYRVNTRGRLLGVAALAGFRVREVRFIASTAALALVLPLAVLELLWIRLLMTERFAPQRQTLIALLERSEEG